MSLSYQWESFRHEIERTLAHFWTLKGNENHEAALRIMVSRGVGRIGFGKSFLDTPTQWIILAQPCQIFSDEEFEKGMRMHVSHRLRNDRRALDPAMKSGNYLNCLLAALEAQEKGCEDAILPNADGHLTEGSRSNIFYVRRGIVATPPLDIGILDGISRKIIFEILTKEKIPYREVRFSASRMLDADEAFISGTVKEIFPIVAVDGKTIGSGKPGPISRLLRVALREAGQRQAKGTP